MADIEDDRILEEAISAKQKLKILGRRDIEYASEASQHILDEPNIRNSK
jgi:hypothetical protein